MDALQPFPHNSSTWLFNCSFLVSVIVFLNSVSYFSKVIEPEEGSHSNLDLQLADQSKGHNLCLQIAYEK